MTKREFETGANRDIADGKFVYNKFSHPLNEYSFAEHMDSSRELPDGTIREPDNWQKGIPQKDLMESLTRHFHQVWLLNEGYRVWEIRVIEDGKLKVKTLLYPVEGAEEITMEKALNGIRFNSEGLKLYEVKKRIKELNEKAK